MRKTIYQKIYQDLLSKLKTRAFREGDLLPSTRELSKLYRCHRFTVMRVYQDLVAEGWIESTERSRYKASSEIPVVTSREVSRAPRSKELKRRAKPLPKVDLERTRYRLEFWGGQPDLRIFPKDEFRRILSGALKRTKSDLWGYADAKGLDGCVKQVSDYLRKSRNLTEKEFIITNGSQEALYLIAQAFIKPGDRIAIERKGYPPAWRLFESLGAQLVHIEVDAEGLNTEDLRQKLKKHRCKLIYVTPLHQYPTTVTLGPRRRQDLIQIAEQNSIPILEDDYDHEFHYTGPPPSPLSAETPMGIYVCSFSKVLFPGARLGVIACDQQIENHLLYQKHLISRQTDCLAQMGLAAWLRDGGFERHLRKMRRTYEKRLQVMNLGLEKLKAEFKIDWQNPTGGMSIWLNLNRDSARIAKLAKERGIFFQHESSMDYLKTPGRHLRIGFAGVNEGEIQEGLQCLETLMRLK